MNKLRRNSKRKIESVHTEVNKLNSNSCRICLNPNEKMSNLFNSKVLNNIEYCTGVRIIKTDSLPTKICENCLTSLEVAREFKQLCLLSEQICKDILASEIKEEPPDGYNNDCDIGDNNDNGKDSFKEECLRSSNKVREDISNEVHLNDSFNEDPDSDNDNFIIEIREEGNGITIVKEEKLLCEYEASAEDVQTNVLNVTEVKSHDVRSKPKLRKSPTENTTPVKKRGPYRKRQAGSPPARCRKFAYFRLFCVPCQIKFASKLDADQHRANVHKETCPFMCEICGKMFTHRGSHYSHVRTHLPATHACDHCDYRSANKYDLAKHLLIHAGIKKWQCSRCPAAYFTVSNLRNHERLVHERVLRHACDTCGKMFYDRSHLRRHVDSHNDVKRHECSVCHTAFSRRCYWKKHLLKQHSIVIPPLRPGRGRRTDLLIGEPRDPNPSREPPPAQASI